jgi:hypothetical protein
MISITIRKVTYSVLLLSLLSACNSAIAQLTETSPREMETEGVQTTVRPVTTSEITSTLNATRSTIQPGAESIFAPEFESTIYKVLDSALPNIIYSDTTKELAFSGIHSETQLSQFWAVMDNFTVIDDMEIIDGEQSIKATAIARVVFWFQGELIARPILLASKDQNGIHGIAGFTPKIDIPESAQQGVIFNLITGEDFGNFKEGNFVLLSFGLVNEDSTHFALGEFNNLLINFLYPEFSRPETLEELLAYPLLIPADVSYETSLGNSQQ